jgi:hypothetical protein
MVVKIPCNNDFAKPASSCLFNALWQVGPRTRLVRDLTMVSAFLREPRNMDTDGGFETQFSPRRGTPFAALHTTAP